MPGLILHLFGYPRIERNDEPVHMERRKAVALLAYLAVTQQAHSRDTLATLLWPDLPQRQARTMLRSALVTLNRTFGKGRLTHFEDQLALPAQPGLWVDVNHFHSLLASVTSHRPSIRFLVRRLHCQPRRSSQSLSRQLSGGLLAPRHLGFRDLAVDLRGRPAA